MITEFGKALRKLRIDRNEYIKDMAEKLHISVAYLSAIETGKRKIPENLVGGIARAYGLEQDEVNSLNELKDKSNSEVRISLIGKTSKQEEVILRFAKCVGAMNDEKLDKIVQIMEDEYERKRMEWISVNDRLPKDGEIVLTVKNKSREIQMYESRRNGWISKKGWFWSVGTVTHWIPLPEPPKENKD